ncbi:AAA family ATPase, partial [Treponema pedis]|uniref:AAA family ATPase n=1 Tax=Treponema pedis TaxID=409322 RepID=UPI003D1A8D1F
ETDALVQMVNAITMAHVECDIALIIADAGSGKTTAAKWYYERNSRTTVLIDVVKGMTNKILLQEIAVQLGIEAHRYNPQSLITMISNTLADRNMVVILDEADYLKDDALEFSRRLVYDLGKSGLVLIGKPTFVGKILNLRNDHRQLESRIGVYLPLDGLSVKDARKIAKSVWSEIDNELIAGIYKHSGQDVRLFTKIISRMQNIMTLNKITVVDFDVIDEAAKTIFKRGQ